MGKTTWSGLGHHPMARCNQRERIGAASLTNGAGYVFTLNVPVGFGPFTLPAGQIVTLRKPPGSDSRAANIGNKLFAALKLKMLLDYKSRVMTFYGDCR